MAACSWENIKSRKIETTVKIWRENYISGLKPYTY